MNEADTEVLFAQTLLGDHESKEPWEAVSALGRSGSREVFERAAAWLVSDDPLKRMRAAAILRRLRREPGDPEEAPEWMFREESYSLVTQLLEKEQNSAVLESALCALGHLDDPRAIPAILRYQDHPDKNVRFAVAFSLGCFSNDPQAMSCLLKLTSDTNEDVRDWAVFGLGVQGDADSPEIRETLLRCLDDPNEDVREEAAVGLGRRRDPRLLPKLQSMLDEPGLKVRAAEAASALLGMDQDPPEWVAADYKAALRKRFG